MAVPLLAWYFGYCMEQNSPANQLSIRNIHFVELPYDPAILYLGIKEGNYAIGWYMNRPRDYTLNEVNQTERQISYDIPYMWNLKKKYK